MVSFQPLPTHQHLARIPPKPQYIHSPMSYTSTILRPTLFILPCPTHRDKDEEWRHELPADPPVDHGAKTEHVLDVCAKPSQSWGKGELDEEFVGQIV